MGCLKLVFEVASLKNCVSKAIDPQFNADVEGHPDDTALVHALEELAFFSKELRVLGVYPAHPYRNTFKEDGED